MTPPGERRLVGGMGFVGRLSWQLLVLVSFGYPCSVVRPRLVCPTYSRRLVGKHRCDEIDKPDCYTDPCQDDSCYEPGVRPDAGPRLFAQLDLSNHARDGRGSNKDACDTD